MFRGRLWNVGALAGLFKVCVGYFKTVLKHICIKLRETITQSVRLGYRALFTKDKEIQQQIVRIENIITANPHLKFD